MQERKQRLLLTPLLMKKPARETPKQPNGNAGMMLLFGANMCVCVWLVSMTPKRYQAINYTSSFSALQGDQFASVSFLKKSCNVNLLNEVTWNLQGRTTVDVSAHNSVNNDFKSYTCKWFTL